MESCMNFKTQQETKVCEIETILAAYLPPASGFQSTIMEAMEYSLLAGGKRLRPMLMQEMYQMFGGTGKEIECFMSAIEMIHTYSLVHDDLPAMDDDAYRRGQLTTHKKFGEDMGILAGDALLNYAFEVALQAFDMAPERTHFIAKALQVLGRKAGIYGMLGGQVIDVQASGQTINGEKLEVIFALKTSALIEASMMIGAILAGATEQEVLCVESIASKIGLAFQIQDDILDVTSSTEVLGKPVRSDEKNEKTTYISLYGLEVSQQAVASISQEAINQLDTLQKECLFLKWLIDTLINRKK